MHVIVHRGSGWLCFCRQLKKKGCNWRRNTIKVLIPSAFHGNGCSATQGAECWKHTLVFAQAAVEKGVSSAMWLLLHVIYSVQVSSIHNLHVFIPSGDYCPAGIVGPWQFVWTQGLTCPVQTLPVSSGAGKEFVFLLTIVFNTGNPLLKMPARRGSTLGLFDLVSNGVLSLALNLIRNRIRNRLLLTSPCWTCSSGTVLHVFDVCRAFSPRPRKSCLQQL